MCKTDIIQKKLNVSLISINCRYTHLNLANLYLKKMIEPLNHITVKLLHFTINNSILSILNTIHETKPDIITGSVYIWNKTIFENLIPELKKIAPDCKIILGGPEVSFNSMEWISKFTEIDHIIQGNGEKTLYSLFKSKSLIKEKIIESHPASFNSIPFPYNQSDLIQYKHSYLYYESSRGCPYQCSYCLSSRKELKLDPKDLNIVFEELNKLLSVAPQIVKFVDRTFNFEPKRSRSIWNYLLAQNVQTKFHFEIHPLHLQKEDFEILSKVPPNKFQFEIGIQSFHSKTLKEINRLSKTQVIYDNIKHLVSLKTINIHIGLIAGLPFESYNIFKKTFNMAYELKTHHLQLGFLKVLPGTVLSQKTNKYRIKHLSTPPYEILENKWISFHELNKLRTIEQCLDLLYHSQKFNMTLKYLISFFDDSFSFFESFSMFKDLTFLHSDFSITAKMILMFTEEIFPKKLDLIKDTLRWDWSQKAQSNYYPPFLKPPFFDQSITIKKDICQQFKKEKIIPHTHSLSDFKKAILFKAETKEFQENEQIFGFVLIFGSLKKTTYYHLNLADDVSLVRY